MAFSHGKDATLSVDGSDISAYTDNVSFSRDLDTAEVTAFGDDDKEFLGGLRGATLTASGSYDNTSSTGSDAVLHGAFDGATVAWSYSPDGGTVTYSGNAFVTSYQVSAPVSDKVSWSASLTISGSVTRA